MEFRWILRHGDDVEVLESDPKDYDNLELTVFRDEYFHGIFNEFSFDLGFYCKGGGREFIEGIYKDLGIAETITLEIQWRCNGRFETFYEGQVNLQTYRDDGTYIYCNIEQKGITQLIRGRKRVKVDLQSTESIDGAALNNFPYGPYPIGMHSKSIFLESEIGIRQPTTYTYTDSFTTTGFFVVASHGFDLIKSNIVKTVKNPDYLQVFTSATPPTTCDHPAVTQMESTLTQGFHDSGENEIIRYPATYTIEYSFSGTFTDTASPISRRGTWDLFLSRGSNATNGDLLRPDIHEKISLGGFSYGFTHDAVVTQAFNISGTLTITLQPGDKLFIIWEAFPYNFNPGTTTADCKDVTFSWAYSEANLRMYIDSTTAATTANGFMIHEAFSKNLEIITNTPDVVRSSFFGRTNSNHSYPDNGCGAFNFITNGFQIREFDSGYPIDTSVLTKPVFSTLEDLFDSQNSIWNIGLGIEKEGLNEKVRIEDKSFFYSDTEILKLDNVPNIEVSVDPEKYYGKVVIGNQQWKPDIPEGLDEPNTNREYATVFGTVDNEYIAVNPYITAMYAIEIKRRQNLIPTEDKEYDEDNFVIAMSRFLDGNTPVGLQTPEKSENFSSVTNLTGSDTAYNLRLSPFRNLLRHAKSISGIMYNRPGEEFQFTYGEGNYDMESEMIPDGCDGDYSGANAIEDQSLAWDDTRITSPSLFIPEIYNFEYPVSFAQYKVLKQNLYGYVSFSSGTNAHKKGYIMNLVYTLKTGMAQFTLIRKF